MAQKESRYVRIARKAYELVQAVLPLYSHRKSPHRFTFPQLVACVLLMFYVRKSYRDMEEWLLASDKVCQALDLPTVPHYSTLDRTFQRLRRVHLDRLLHTLLGDLDLAEEVIALDTTGFQPTQASLHFLTRQGRRYDHYLKGGYAVGAQSQLIFAWKSGLGPGADQPFLEPLRRGATRYGRHEQGRIAWFLLGDAGFDSRTARPTDLIPPVMRGRKLRAPARRARSDLVSTARLEGLFGQRWKVETVISVIKRKFGAEIRSWTARRRNLEPMVKGLIYNLHRLVG